MSLPQRGIASATPASLKACHAMAWHALRLAGVADALPRWGRLMDLPG